ncbi:DUF418 domain-containing protein [Winogradskyella alexanderae]|uniref:DUF418 domain-containing protein n=1 Tax=Winogradskyella alexanderae TaxID=2877123 RepID=A0ABS7XRT7_9FLAO|nr:DUF418 domain-containing protein [Winogradskyella alexanderae]MCA0132739.1 DUF418 domain-containing protein [Winogradskyella alexanderae]
MNQSTNHPVLKKDRIIALDILRGLAILGILIMNIQSFSMPGAAYLNPMAYGDITGINKWVWILSHVFADQKFMTIFSILFGAGVIIFTQNAERRSGKSAGLHYSRTFWLLIIGLIHAHFIWYGDILVSYALCGFLVYLFRKLKSKPLLIIGILFISVHSLIYLFFGMSIGYWPEASVAETQNSWLPPIEALQQEINAYTGSFSEQMAQRSASAFMLETFVFLTTFLWRAGGLMLVGMAFYKWGIISASKSKAFYVRGWLISWLIGLPIIIYGLIQLFANNWSMEYGMFLGSQYNYWGSLFVSFGYICIIMLFVKSEKFKRLKSRLAAVGRMALTNYLMQSILCIFIFYGIGFALFGEIDRTVQIVIVIAIWLLQLWWSKPWLKKYLFGPFEWLWRSLSYRKRQPFKVKQGQL